MRDNDNVVLLVDDDEDDRDFFHYATRNLNHSFSFKTMADGTSLIEYLSVPENNPPHFIFLDINMPKLNGFETLALIRTMYKQEELPVSMYSTSSAPPEVLKASELGANLYLIKPVDMDSLTTIIRHVLSNNHEVLRTSKYFIPLPER